ncbi:unnamed protein product [Brugia pahangi]|uniref:Hydrolase_4 domain-containing protein n=1 Tax=Brugia pahangi TaxID=6280 RepID=A0A0N4TQB7_BRUPA|nr:unnamed protein product [Brugia pahangi]
MSIVASANDEISDQELISVTGIVTSNELISDHADNLKCMRHAELQSNDQLVLNDLKSERIKKASKKRRCYCCQLCLLLLKFTGILCYIFCCPPIPEMVIRKLAFHPLKRGKTYVLSGKDIHGNFILINNAKKALKFTSLKFETQNLIDGSSILMDGIETSIIKTRRGSHLPILMISNNLSNDESKNLVVLFSQPNSSDLGCYFHPRGLNFRDISKLLKTIVYAYDYSGYGISTGSPSEKNIYADIEAAYKHISESQGPNVRIALLGYSIGTVPTIYMASKHPPNLCGIVLIAPLASGLRLYTKVNRTCCMDRFLSYDRASNVNVPVLICHGCMDNIIPKNHSEILMKRFPRAVPPFYVDEANHLTIFSKQSLSVFFRIRYFLFNETDQLHTLNV